MRTESGMFVTLEGLDNAGKTTLTGLISKTLRAKGIACCTTKELTTDIGGVFQNRYLRPRTATTELKVLAFAADRIERQQRVVLPGLARGDVVIADRWVHSAVAYRLAEVTSAKRKSLLRYIQEVNRPCLVPDRALYIDISPEVSFQRGDPGYPANHLEAVRAQYLKLVQMGQLLWINGNRAKAEVVREAIAFILSPRGKLQS